MKRQKFYFESIEHDVCHTEEYFQDLMMFGCATEVEVIEAILDLTGGGVFWCKVYSFCGDDTSDSCGKQCEEYKPKNGKNGCCKHHTSWLFLHGDKVTLKYKK